MAKTYLNTTKYIIKMKFEIDGIVDKPDIIGAIFGQSEGLLGEEMDLKELQKNGKIGRIEINHSTSMGKTKGEVYIPSSLDVAETSILAAGIETVEKVGPCEAKFELIDIEDTRAKKRTEIKDRAKEILKKIMEKNTPEMQNLSEEIREKARASEIIEYGPDKLPAGPDIEKEQEIIVVEGRADVINLLKNQIKNVIGMNGSNITKTLIDLTKNKIVTVFVDGDRGGILNARKLMQIAKVDYIARAPDGKEVEELTRKEILLSLKKKEQVHQQRYTERPKIQRQYKHMPRTTQRTYTKQPWKTTTYKETTKQELTNQEQEIFKPHFEELKGTMKARIIDNENQVIKEMKVKDIMKEITEIKGAKAIVFDGVIT
ncbi:MAG: DNA primase DnaG, partial [Candidatus Diapherotrites archaeon]